MIIAMGCDPNAQAYKEEMTARWVMRWWISAAMT